MKYFLLVIICSYAFLGCKPSDQINEEDLPAFKEDGVAYIRWVNDSKRPQEISTMYPSLYDIGAPAQKRLNVDPGKDTIFSVPLRVPQVKGFAYKGTVQFFLTYDDTLTIIAHPYETENSYIIHKFSFEGKFKNENEVLQLLENRKSMSSNASLFQDVNLTMSEYASKLDSLTSEKIEKLDSLYQSDELSELFYNIYKTDLLFSDARSKLSRPSFLEFQTKTPVNPDQSYYSYLNEIDFNNDYGKYSGSYLSFLNTYAWHLEQLAWDSRFNDFDKVLRNERDSMIAAYFDKKIDANNGYAYDSALLSWKLDNRISFFKEVAKSINDDTKDFFYRNIANYYLRLFPFAEAQMLVSKIQGLFGDSSHSNELQTYLLNATAKITGKKAPYFELESPQMTYRSINDFKGQLLYVNFWGPWCKPCIAEIPYEKSLAKKLNGTNVLLVNICVHCDEKSWQETIKKKDMPGIHLIAKESWNQKLVNDYMISGFPHYTLIDKEGKIIANPTYRPSSPQLYDFIIDHLD